MIPLRIHYKNLVFCFAVGICIAFIFFLSCQRNKSSLPSYDSSSYETIVNKERLDYISPKLQKKTKEKLVDKHFLQKLTREKKCPVCLGYDICEEITVEFVKLSSSQPLYSQKDLFDIYEGAVGNLQKVSLKVQTSNYDGIVCIDNNNSPEECKFNQTLEKFFPFNDSTYSSVSNMRRKLGLIPSNIMLSKCKNTRLEALMRLVYDINQNKKLDDSEQKILFTSLILAPEVVATKIVGILGFTSSFPSLLGCCGRISIFQNDFTKLSLFLDKPFLQRVSLASQLLTTIQHFLDTNSDWLLMQPIWNIDDILVDPEGEIFFSTVDNIIFTPKLTTEHESQYCGKECIYELQEKAVSSSESLCLTYEQASHLMFAKVCQMILSDMKQHKFIDYYKTISAPSQHRAWIGLLHTVPDEERQDVEKFLSLCVDETTAGERVVAVEDLQDLLSDILEEAEADYQDDDDETDDDEEETDVVEILKKSYNKKFEY